MGTGNGNEEWERGMGMGNGNGEWERGMGMGTEVGMGTAVGTEVGTRTAIIKKHHLKKRISSLHVCMVKKI
jgi:hypothetical protein